jgi:hypothetical protein
MFDVFLCHAAADRALAGHITERLSRAECRVITDECGREPDETVAASWECGMECGGIVLLLSPDSVPPSQSRLLWGGLLEHVTESRRPPIVSVLVRPCAVPPLLERRSFWVRWDSGDSRSALRALENWAVGLSPATQPDPLLLAHLPWFDHDKQELAVLWDALVDRSGTASATTSVAQEFARQARQQFRKVLWIPCGDRPEALIATEIASGLGSRVDAPAPELWKSIQCVLRTRRVLLVLDEFHPELELLEPGNSSLLLIPTLKRRDPEFALPVGSAEERLWEALSVCRPQRVSLDLAARIAELEPTEAAKACQALIRHRFVDPLDSALVFVRRNVTAVESPAMTRAHFKLLRDTFSDWRANRSQCLQCLDEIEPAVRRACQNGWNDATMLGWYALAFLRDERRLADAEVILNQLRNAALLTGDTLLLSICTKELNWLFEPAGSGPCARTEPGNQLSFDFRI